MPRKSKNKKKKEKKNYKYPKEENTQNPERNLESKKNKKSRKNYKKRNWNEYLKENPANFEINLKKRKENKIQNDLQDLDLEENNKNDNQNTDIKKTGHESNKDKEILDPEKNINIENNKHILKNKSNFGKEELHNFKKENLGNEKSNINTNQFNKQNNWTEILYNIVDNFSEESLFANNSEESIKPKKDKKEIKNQIRETDNNSDTIENEKKTKNLSSISLTKNRNYSNYEDLTKTEKIKNYQKLGILEQDQINVCDDNTIIFDGKEFKCFNRDNIYKRNDDLKRYIYKCINYRKEEKFREKNKLKKFCSATIVYIPPGQKKKSGYNLKEGHSIECLELGKENKNKKEKIKKKRRNL